MRLWILVALIGVVVTSPSMSLLIVLGTQRKKGQHELEIIISHKFQTVI